MLGFKGTTHRLRGFGKSLGSQIRYLLRDEFTTAASAPLSSPRTCEPGPGSLTLIQTDGQFSISSGALQIPAQATPLVNDQGYYDATGMARTAGRAAIWKFNISTLGLMTISWNPSASPGWFNTMEFGYYFPSTGTLAIGEGGSQASLGYTLTTGTDYLFALVHRASSGGYGFIKGGAFTNWTLLWVFTASAAATLHAALATYSQLAAQDYLRITDITALSSGISIVNVASPVSLSQQTSTADQIIDLTVTAPAVLANECGIRYRITDANNYWRAYFNSAGAFRVDSISGGVATNRINVAGVIAGGGTATIRVICEGSLHDAFTLGTAWVKRGSQLNVSHQNTSTAISAEIGTGWTAANLRSYARTSSTYAALDGV